jgi:hypothetical protein
VTRRRDLGHVPEDQKNYHFEECEGTVLYSVIQRIIWTFPTQTQTFKVAEYPLLYQEYESDVTKKRICIRPKIKE